MSDETSVAEEKGQPGVETFTTKESEKEGARSIEIDWSMGKDLKELGEKFGETTVYNVAVRQLVIMAQAGVRRMLAAKNEDGSQKHSDSDIRNWVENTYKPGVRQVREGSSKAFEKAVSLLAKLSDEERAEFLADPQAFVAKLKAGK